MLRSRPRNWVTAEIQTMYEEKMSFLDQPSIMELIELEKKTKPHSVNPTVFKFFELQDLKNCKDIKTDVKNLRNSYDKQSRPK